MESARLAALPLPVERDLFLRRLLRELAGTLEAVVGLEEAEGYISVVGRSMGAWLNETYRQALGGAPLPRETVAAVLVDLKARIGGGFTLREVSEGRIVLENDRCPFEEMVAGRPSLCMMTSNVFGTVVSANLGYAKVVLERTIARGDGGCRVVIHLREAQASGEEEGREYFGD